jgi:hypothetical protein
MPNNKLYSGAMQNQKNVLLVKLVTITDGKQHISIDCPLLSDIYY